MLILGTEVKKVIRWEVDRNVENDNSQGTLVCFSEVISVYLCQSKRRAEAQTRRPGPKESFLLQRENLGIPRAIFKLFSGLEPRLEG